MTSQYRHRRTSNPATPAPTLEPGEIAVNTANRQLHLGDAASGTLGTPKPLLPIRFFDTAAMYAIGDLIVQAGKGYRAIAANGPGAFNVAQWELSGTQLLVSPTAPVGVSDGTLWWDSSTDSGQLYVLYNDGNTTQWVIAVPQPSVNQFVQKAGDTMTGPLSVPNLLVKPASGTGVITLQDGAPSTTTTISQSATRVKFENNAVPLELNANTNGGTVNQLVLATDGNVYLSKNLAVGNEAPAASINFGNLANRTLSYDGTNYGFVGGALLLPGATAAQQALTRQTIYAAPFDALAYNGMQVNGGFDVNQAAIASTPVGYFCDNWTASKNGTMVIVATAGSSGGAAAPNVGVVQVTTAQASIAAGDYTCIGTVIEGYRMARLGWGTPYAQPITVGFSSCHHRPGTYSVRLNNIGGNRSYTATYTQNSADTWEWKTITIPGDTTGTWDKTNGTGTNLSFVMACGSTYTSPANGVWTAGNFLAGPGQINGVAATSDIFRLTNVVVLPGTEAPPEAKAPLIMRPYDQELLTCQRYFYATAQGQPKGASVGTVLWTASATTLLTGYAKWGVTMRAAPTCTLWNNGVQNQVRTTSSGAVVAVPLSGLLSSQNGVNIITMSAAAIIVGTPYDFDFIADARL